MNSSHWCRSTPASRSTRAAYLRHTDPGSIAGVPGLSLGLKLDEPLGSDWRLLAIGVAFETVLGQLPAPVL